MHRSATAGTGRELITDSRMSEGAGIIRVMSDVDERIGLASRAWDGRDTLQWRRGDLVENHDVTAKLVELPIVDGQPVRVGAQWQNRPNRHGLYFWSATKTHVWYESALEASCLACLDQSGVVAQIVAQPFRILFRTESAVTRHDPDFFAVLRNGDQVVYDVKPASRMSAQARLQFEETARVCAEVGWRHVVLHEPDPIMKMNLGFLGSARHRRCHPPGDTFEQICSVFGGGRTVQDGRSMINRRFPALSMPYIRHLIWHQVLATDLARRLDFDSVLITAPGRMEAPCCD